MTIETRQGWAFRSATQADVPELVALVESAYRGESSRAGWTTEADLLEGQRTDPASVGEVIGAAGGRILVLEDEEGIAACCRLEHREDHAYFGMFAVRPGRQGGGVGKAVMAEAERIAREEWGAREMRMAVIIQREDLIAYYVRRGYHRTGELSPFPYGDERFGLPLRDDLAFEDLVKPLA